MKTASFFNLLVPFALMAASAQASVLMLDFGPTAVSTPSNSPYHSVNGSAGTSWNKISTAANDDNQPVLDVTSGMLFADGSDATGVSVNLGVATGTIIGLGTQPTRNSPLGGTHNSGIYATGSVGRDGVFAGTSVPMGVQITGLAAGTYDVYLATRNTSFNGDYKQISFAGAGTADANYDYTGYGSSTLTFVASAAPSTWVQGESYVKLTVNLAAGEALNIAVAGESGGNPDRGIINALQIVSVPEPGYGVMACGFLVTLAFRRQARRD